MLNIHKISSKILMSAMVLLFAQFSVHAQTTQPKWWFGLSAAANATFFSGTTQRLNSSLIVPTAFHKGKGIRPFGSFLIEYRPTPVWGMGLNLGYDGRGGKFDDVIAPCDCPATLKTNASYLTIEPSLRLSPGGGNFYLFAGPRIGLNLQKDFNYTQLKQPNADAEFNEVKKTIISGQVGMGYDIPVSSPNSITKFIISPFVSYHPYFGQDVRNIESWSISTVRAGLAFKLGKAKKVLKEQVILPMEIAPEVSFSVRPPKGIVVTKMVSETLPLLNYIFFDEGSTDLPERYVLLSKTDAGAFKEVQLEQLKSTSSTQRSARQLNVYYNVLNILGDRLRSNPDASIVLSGASLKGPAEGKTLAASVKTYLTEVFGIQDSRISINGRKKPMIPSEQPGAVKELDRLRAGDRRVDIQSTSPELMSEVGGGLMKSVQIKATQGDAMDNHVLFNVSKADKVLKSYTIELTDQNGQVQHYGPYTKNQESVAGKTILGTNASGDYKVVMLGITKNDNTIRKESTVRLQSQIEQLEQGLRYSILFNFNKATTVATYQQFLNNVVVPLITDGSIVTIHGHTDVIGTEEYNTKLSQKRADETQKIISSALLKTGKTNVRFETMGFGEDTARSPFNNNRPEERFYNRTVVIDINPIK